MLIDRLHMTEEDWFNLPGGTEEAAWITRSQMKLALGAELAEELLEIAELLEGRGSTYVCSEDVLTDIPMSAYWYVCLGGFSLKTTQNIKAGPRAFGVTRSIKGMVEKTLNGTPLPEEQRAAFSDWINDAIDGLHPDEDRSTRKALSIVSMIAGGKVLGQSQNIGGDDAVTVCKGQIVRAINSLDIDLEVVSEEGDLWEAYTADCNIASATHFRIPNRAMFQFLPGGNRPDMVVFTDDGAIDFVEPRLPAPGQDLNLIAVAEIKGRLDLANSWESWMPQVVAHVRQWTAEYPNAARIFMGTLLSGEMCGLNEDSPRETLQTVYEDIRNDRRCLTAAYNIAKVADRDGHSVAKLEEFVREINENA